MDRLLSLDPVRDNIVNEMFPLGLCQPVVLLMAFEQVQQQAKRHRPDLILRQVKLGDAKIKQPGKQLFVAYPTCAFFGFVSLSMLRFVPRYSASVMAVLYSPRSEGTVRSSTSSVVRTCFGLSACFRL